MIETLQTTEQPDVFSDVSKLALDQSFDDLTANIDYVHVPIRKPNKQSFIRVHPSEDYRMQLAMLEIEPGAGGDQQLFAVVPELAPSLSDLPGLSARLVVLAVARPDNVPFLWPLKLPRADRNGRDAWSWSALEVVRRAQSEWLRVTPNLQMGCYTAYVTRTEWPEPKWPELTMGELLRRALGDNGVIKDISHPAVRALRGEA